MYTSIKKIFSLFCCLLFFTQSIPVHAGWQNYFPSSLSFNTNNVREWTIPALGIAVIALGYIGYKYFFGSNKKNIQPEEQKNEHASKPEPKPHKEEVKTIKPTVITTWQLEVLAQTDPSSCGLHSLKNAIGLFEYLPFLDEATLQKTMQQEQEEVPILKLLKDESYFFLNNCIPRFKPYVRRIREKTALKEYIQKQILEPCLQNNEDQTYKNAIVNCSSGIAEQAIKHLELYITPFFLPTTSMINALYQSIPRENRNFYTISDVINSFNFNTLGERLNITRETITQAVVAKYLAPILKKYNITLSPDETKTLITTLYTERYENFVRTIHSIKDTDVRLREKIQPLQQQMQTVADNELEPLLQEIARIKRDWLKDRISECHELAFPEHEVLLDQFIANPYIFADVQGFWLEGDELRKLITQACDFTVQKNITVIDSVDELTTVGFVRENKDLAQVKDCWCSLNQYSHACIINTASQLSPEHRGHWFVIVIHKLHNEGEFIVLNSGQKKDRHGQREDGSFGELPCDYFEYVKILKDYLQG